MNRKAFVLLSGGIDSTTALYMAREQFDEVEALGVFYGQRHIKEWEYAQHTCDLLNIPRSLLDVGALLKGPEVMLTDPNVEVPNISYDEIKGVSPTYVPFRNGTLLSAATAHAQKWVMQEIDRIKLSPGYDPDDTIDQDLLDSMRDSASVFYGAHAEDAHNWAYPDCTPEFIGAMANAIYIGTYQTIRLRTPLMWMSKWQIIQEGEMLGVDWKNTWSCYKGETYHCGVCPTCRARKGAFDIADVTDPTEYAA